MRLCSYVVKYDSGFAPNPFWGYCTVAVCTPNHQGLRLRCGDWILGNSPVSTGNRLIYAMRVSDVLGFDEYYRDPRFTSKKPGSRSWRKKCGDNIYFRDEAGSWKQVPNYYHDEGEIKKDTRHPRVFISDHFFYFGKRAPVIRAEYRSLIQTRQGCRCCRDSAVARAFVTWLERSYRPGLRGLPRGGRC